MTNDKDLSKKQYFHHNNGGIFAELRLSNDDYKKPCDVVLDIGYSHFDSSPVTVSVNFTSEYLGIEDGDALLRIRALGEYLVHMSHNPHKITGYGVIGEDKPIS